MRSKNFIITSGSLVGIDHVYGGINNQDALGIVSRKNRIVGIVFDGCGSGSRTEFGSIFAAQWLPSFIADYPYSITDESMKLFGDKICQKISQMANVMDIDDEYKSNLIVDHFLFTILGFIIEEEQTYIFGLGDGVYLVNNVMTILDPDEGKDVSAPDFISNAPDYIAYNLIGGDVDLKILETMKTSQVESLIVGTDGLIDIENKQRHILKDGEIQGGVSQFLDPKFKNIYETQKRLYTLGTINNQLRDDTTLIIVS